MFDTGGGGSPSPLLCFLQEFIMKYSIEQSEITERTDKQVCSVS